MNQGVLATDLDGTFIPLQGDEQNRRDLHTLARLLVANNVQLVYVTGRHYRSVAQAMDDVELPPPDWMICDVGTSLFQRQPSGEFRPVAQYREHLSEIAAGVPTRQLQRRLEPIDGLRLQEEEKQGEFKLSYYVVADRLAATAKRVQEELSAAEAPYSLIQSVDPFTNDGLIDLLPSGVSKAHALAWWARFVALDPSAIVYAGDTGNDLAALVAGYRAIVVGNAERSLAQQVHEEHQHQQWQDRLYLARGHATSGVLEGCRWYGLLPPEDASLV